MRRGFTFNAQKLHRATTRVIRRPGPPRSCRTGGRRRCRPRTCTPRSWRACRADTGRRRGALGRGSGCRCARCSRRSLPGSPKVRRGFTNQHFSEFAPHHGSKDTKLVPPLCASPHSRNATRELAYVNTTKNGLAQGEHLNLAPGLYTYRKNPFVLASPLFEKVTRKCASHRGRWKGKN